MDMILKRFNYSDWSGEKNSEGSAVRNEYNIFTKINKFLNIVYMNILFLTTLNAVYINSSNIEATNITNVDLESQNITTNNLICTNIELENLDVNYAGINEKLIVKDIKNNVIKSRKIFCDVIEVDDIIVKNCIKIACWFNNLPLYAGEYNDLENIYLNYNLKEHLKNNRQILIIKGFHIRFYSGEYINCEVINNSDGPIYDILQFNNSLDITKITIKKL